MASYVKQSLIVLLLLSSSIKGWTWSGRGHALVCETAAYLASSSNDKKNSFLKSHSFDLGYYCNVPDLIWKRPKTYKKEFVNHFMNLEYFDEAIAPDKRRSKDSPFQLSRKDFDRKFKEIPEERGRSWWRIQELVKKIEGLTAELKKTKVKIKERQKNQGEWLLTVGILGHYVGDLAMPLHVSKNYDGQFTKQKGIHHFFEGKMVDELYLDGDFGLQEKVYQKALKLWPSFLKENKKKATLLLAQELSRNSQVEASKLLELDKKTGRSDQEKAKKAYKEMLVARLAQGVLYQALIIHKNLGWSFEGKKFFKFYERPSFMDPSSPK